MKFCTFSLCKKHLQPIIINDAKEDTESDLRIDEDDDSEPFHDSSFDACIDEEIFPNFLITDTLDNVDSISSSNNDDDSVSLVDDIFSHNDDHQSTDDDDELENASMSFDDSYKSETFANIILPTTDSSKVVHWIKDSVASSIPLSVLFNKHLHLLVRRNFELKATKRAKGFLERIVATTEEDCVPLLYPEGMLFPQIFFHQRNDGSIDGSIPSPLWNSNKIVQAFNIASIVDHMRSRITNSSIRCSTEPTYLFFAFDAISNCLCHEAYPQLVLARGYEHMLQTASIYGKLDDSFLGATDVIDPRKTVQELAESTIISTSHTFLVSCWKLLYEIPL